MQLKNLLVFISTVLISGSLIAQQPIRDTGQMVERKNAFWDSIKTTADKFANPEKPRRKVFQIDLSKRTLPERLDQFEQVWHLPPISQGRSGMCWCFSTTSFFESEIHRLSGREIKLSEIYTVYWEYVEKARRYIRERGESALGQGSEANAVPRIWKQYGIVPAEAYPGLKAGQKFHDHDRMFGEIRDYLHSLKDTHAWNEETAIRTVRSIMNHYLGEPPSTITVDGRKITPQQYLSDYLKLNLDDYLNFMSLMEKPYWEQVEYQVPDNWWKSTDYYNLPLDEFTALAEHAAREGYSFVIGGDVSEAGYVADRDVAVVPTFDIPSAYIDENARQFRFSNHSTEDDHAIHVVGHFTLNGDNWYLIKDSGSGSRNGKNVGYYFYHEDYIKLKMMNIFVHKDAAKKWLKKFEN